MTYDLVIRGGGVVADREVLRADVAVVGERIAALGQGLRGREEIDLRRGVVAMREGDLIETIMTVASPRDFQRTLRCSPER